MSTNTEGVSAVTGKLVILTCMLCRFSPFKDIGQLANIGSVNATSHSPGETRGSGATVSSPFPGNWTIMQQSDQEIEFVTQENSLRIFGWLCLAACILGPIIIYFRSGRSLLTAVIAAAAALPLLITFAYVGLRCHRVHVTAGCVEIQGRLITKGPNRCFRSGEFRLDLTLGKTPEEWQMWELWFFNPKGKRVSLGLQEKAEGDETREYDITITQARFALTQLSRISGFPGQVVEQQARKRRSK